MVRAPRRQQARGRARVAQGAQVRRRAAKEVALSVFRDQAIPCAACGHVEHRSIAESINAGNREDLRRQIVEDRFQRFACPRCGREAVVDGPLLVIHFERHHWLEMFPAPWEAAWQVLEQDTARRFEQTVVDVAPPMVQVHAGEFVVRTVFGMPGLREKLVAFDAEIDDRALEALKLDVLRGEAELIADPTVRLRLRDATETALAFTVHRGPRVAGELAVARAHLETTAAEAWQPTRDAVSGGPYVDAGRILVDGGGPRPR